MPLQAHAPPLRFLLLTLSCCHSCFASLQLLLQLLLPFCSLLNLLLHGCECVLKPVALLLQLLMVQVPLLQSLHVSVG